MVSQIPAIYELPLHIVFRFATEADLPLLEWYGQYIHFRRVYQRTYHEQTQGGRWMLVADLNGFPVGQLFVVPELSYYPQTGYFYSFRVMDHLQGLGIGTHLLHYGEALLHAGGIQSALISAVKSNSRARQLYERLGYRVFREDEGRWQYTNHLGEVIEVHEPCWILEKQLQ